MEEGTECRQEGCSSSTIDLTCTMAERARVHVLLQGCKTEEPPRSRRAVAAVAIAAATAAMGERLNLCPLTPPG
uniref:Uncharacterized protein n=1 Tax=Vespula pensylvanica TaxID=30213 RepID=A0A834U8Z9_VESPE|nr:hypothetical protein H0235_009922 [Vespula pensylvanica]